MKSCCSPKNLARFFLVVLLGLLISGCANFQFGTMTKSETKPAEVKEAEPKSRETTAVYYDFEDVLIPKELNVVKERTVVVSTPGFTSGIIALKGMVERTSLFNFFNQVRT